MLDGEVIASVAALLPATLPTLRVCSRGRSAFDVFDEHGKLVGSSGNEMQAIWSAVTAAEEMSRSGVTVRVVMARESGDVEQFVARPPA
jgi:hypothetical protein